MPHITKQDALDFTKLPALGATSTEANGNPLKEATWPLACFESTRYGHSLIEEAYQAYSLFMITTSNFISSMCARPSRYLKEK